MSISRGRPSPYVPSTFGSSVCAANTEGSSAAARMAGIATYLIRLLPRCRTRSRSFYAQATDGSTHPARPACPRRTFPVRVKPCSSPGPIRHPRHQFRQGFPTCETSGTDGTKCASGACIAMTLPLLGVVAVVALCVVLLIGGSSRRKSALITTHAELVKRVKRLP